MGDKKNKKEQKQAKEKDKCCEKYAKKGKHCSNCPVKAECPVPE